jgi:hypothetical protein
MVMRPERGWAKVPVPMLLVRGPVRRRRPREPEPVRMRPVTGPVKAKAHRLLQRPQREQVMVMATVRSLQRQGPAQRWRLASVQVQPLVLVRR